MAGHAVAGFPVAAPGAAALAANESPLPPGPGVMAAIAAQLPSVNRYPDPAATALRAALAARFEVGSDQVLVGHGASELLWAIAAATLDEEARFVFPTPSYYAYPAFAELTGAAPVPVPLDVRLRNDLAAMAAAVGSEGAGLVCVCNPNTPTGGSVEPVAIRRLLDAIPATCSVVIDEAFWEFSRNGDQAETNESLAAAANLVIVRTFSKAHRLAGARVGYAVFASAELAGAVDARRASFPVSALAEAAALAALADEAGLAAHLEAVIASRERLREGLVAAGFAVAESEANFVWAVPPSGCADTELAARAAAAGVLVAVGSELCGNNGLRVTAGTMDECERAIDALRRALEENG